MWLQKKITKKYLWDMHKTMNVYFAQNGTADAASMFGDDIYAAGFCHGLELAAGESYNGVGKSHV